MTESVSDILVARQREFDGVARPVAASLVVHGLLVVALAVLPAAWFQTHREVRTMTISLGAGSIGPKRTGELSTGGRRVDQVVEPKAREPIVPVTPPKTATPDPAATVIKTPPKPTDKSAPAPATPAAPKPSTGAKVAPGSALVETGAKGLEVGLASGGAGGNSAEMESCCKMYFSDLRDKIEAVWLRNQGATGIVAVDFVIERNGTITDVRISQSSGNDLLDTAAQRAVLLVRLAPLPSEYTGQRMLMTLKFPYTR